MRKLAQNWVDLDHATLRQIPLIWQDWMTDTGSFTELLRTRTGQSIEVNIIHDGRASVASDESVLFTPPIHRCRVREVFLQAQGRPVVMARSVLPTVSSTGLNRDVLQLGARPLGEVLFSKKKPPILRRQITEIPNLGWGRRTIYQLRNHPILITEILLPALADFLSDLA